MFFEQVGGETNVKSVTHCATRLRFVLVDPAKADKEAIGAIPGVLAVVENAGQLQVVIGNDVPLVYEGLGEVSALLDDDAPSAAGARRATRATRPRRATSSHAGSPR